MQVVLVMFRSDGERRSFSVTRDITVIGRREDCDLRIPLGDVSRKHARLVRDGDTIKLEDLGSSNGTFLNGQRVQESLLAAGDTIQVGPVIFVIQIDGVPVDEELHPVLMEPGAATGGVEHPEGSAGNAMPPPMPPPLPSMMSPEEMGDAVPGTGVGTGASFHMPGGHQDVAAGEDMVELTELEDLEPIPEGELTDVESGQGKH